jgi:uncharacterized protein (TIGR03067 family)
MFNRRNRNHLAAFLAAAMSVVWVLACATHRSPEVTAKPKQAPTVRAPEARSVLLNQLQGKWVGHPAQNESDRWQWVIAGDRIEAKTSEGEYYKGMIRLNDQTSPIRMDVNLTDCKDTTLNGQIVQGIVKLEGKKVTFCITEPGGGAYPTAFDSSQGMLIVGEKE